ncbi:DNA repair protein XRCC3 isoform X2 [Hyaena hyaena]|uniref:DNA repair protein XRCC3 isoform X2 n=1 Tax=Hyaena hyaena TaxID=95912 RepID=UPI001922CCE9|nr:DNA repair protein XRCC3 isoform X2 [Hyaena hyaena]
MPGLRARTAAKLKSVKEVLHFSGPDLQRLTGLSSLDVQHLLRTASLHVRGGSIVTALHLHQQKKRFPAQHQRLSLGCPVLDGLLRGGLPLDGVTELAGHSSAGKTQLALQLCLAVQLPPRHGGLEAGAVYVCTEDVFPNSRLQQLIAQQRHLRADVPGEVIAKVRFGSQIFIEHVADVDALLECVRKKVPVLLSRGMARLVVIDSVAAPFRCEFDGPASVPRARRLQELGATLRRLSSTFQSPVLCINQVGPAPLMSLAWFLGRKFGAGVWGRGLPLVRPVVLGWVVADPGLDLPGDGGRGGAGRGTRTTGPLGGAGLSRPRNRLVQPALNAADGQPAPLRGAGRAPRPHAAGDLRPSPAPLILLLHGPHGGSARDSRDHGPLTRRRHGGRPGPRKPESGRAVHTLQAQGPGVWTRHTRHWVRVRVRGWLHLLNGRKVVSTDDPPDVASTPHLPTSPCARHAARLGGPFPAGLCPK